MFNKLKKIEYKILSLLIVFCLIFSMTSNIVFAEGDSTEVYGVYMKDDKTYEADSSGNKLNEKVYGDIGKGADLDKTAVTKVFIHSDVTELKDNAFDYWKNLNEVVFQNPTAIKKIGASVFYKSSLAIFPLETLTSLEELGSHTLGNTELTSVTVPSSVTKMTGEFSPFDQCSKLTEINIASGNDHFKSIDGILFTKDGKTLLTYPMGKPYVNEYSIPNGIETISGSAFSSSRMPQDPITNDILYYPSNIGIIKIPASVTTIKTNNFGAATMSACPNLKRIEVDENNKNYKDIDGVLFTNDGKKLLVYPSYGRSNKLYSVPNGVEIIGSCAFSTNGEGDLNYQILRKIEFPESINKLEIAAFEHSDFTSGNTSVFVLNSITPPDMYPGDTPGSVKTFGSKTAEVTRTFYVPDDALVTYKTNEKWDAFAGEIKSHSDMIGEFTFAVTPNTETVALGDTAQFETTLGGNAYKGAVSKATWTVENATSSDTKIDANGMLTVGADETATSLTVTATSTVSTSKSASATVTVTDATPAITRTITATAGANGTISPNGSVTVADGGSQTFTFTPDAGYEIGNLTVNGGPEIPTGNSYTIPNVTADMAINIDFVKTSTPTLPTVDGNKTMTVGAANDVIFTIDADFDKFDRVEYNGSTLGTGNYTAKSGSIVITLKGDYVKTLGVGTHTFTAVLSSAAGAEQDIPMDLIVESVNVKPPKTNEYTVTVNLNGGNGNPSGAGDYEADETVTIKAGTRSGYDFDSWTVERNNVTLANANSNETTFKMPNYQVTVTANWEKRSSGGETPPPTDDTHKNPQTGVPQTGDSSNVILYLFIAIISLGGIIFGKKLKVSK